MERVFSHLPEPSKHGGGRAAERVPGRYLDSPLEREARYSAMDSAPSGSYPDIPASRSLGGVSASFFFFFFLLVPPAVGLGNNSVN